MPETQPSNEPSNEPSDESSDEPSAIRASARVLLVDARDRLLLLRTKAAPDAATPATMWLTVGGGVEPGEDLPQAAARELHEETGLQAPPEALGPIVATTTGQADRTWLKGTFHDDFFFLRITAHDLDTTGFQPQEASTYLGHHWWSIAELETTTERIVPNGLAALLRDLLAGRFPPAPVQLPWR